MSLPPSFRLISTNESRILSGTILQAYIANDEFFFRIERECGAFRIAAHFEPICEIKCECKWLLAIVFVGAAAVFSVLLSLRFYKSIEWLFLMVCRMTTGCMVQLYLHILYDGLSFATKICVHCCHRRNHKLHANYSNFKYPELDSLNASEIISNCNVRMWLSLCSAPPFAISAPVKWELAWNYENWDVSVFHGAKYQSDKFAYCSL